MLLHMFMFMCEPTYLCCYLQPKNEQMTVAKAEAYFYLKL